MIIAIDGPAASGKGTLAREIAKKLGYSYLDTGKLYRAVGKKMLDAGLDVLEADDHSSSAAEEAVSIAKNMNIGEISNVELASEGVGAAASIVSAIPGVRKALLEFQREVAQDKRGAVLDGRDIGTVVCPDADFKFFITASLEARAKRRYKELQKKDNSVIYAEVLEDLERRDKRDTQRNTSPMKVAEDAIRIDTTEMGIDEVLKEVLSIISSSTS